MLLLRTVTCIILTNSVALARYARFTNVKCVKLQNYKRGVVGLNVHIELYKLPMSNMSVNLSIHKRASGFRPFLYDVSADFCEFMKHRKRYPVINILVGSFLKDSNINHTCPYDHDLIVTNFVLQESSFSMLPLPDGEYMFLIKLGGYNVWKADIKTYFSMKE